jgi:hypothetical protein
MNNHVIKSFGVKTYEVIKVYSHIKDSEKVEYDLLVEDKATGQLQFLFNFKVSLSQYPDYLEEGSWFACFVGETDELMKHLR